MVRKKTHQEFVEELESVNPRIEVLGQYINSGSRIAVRCRDCGHEWAPLARSLVNVGQGCPVCRSKQAHLRKRKTTEQFIKELHSVNPTIEVTGEYVTSKHKIECRCLTCGNTWKATPANLKSGYGCPRCARTGTSFMEQFVLVSLERILGSDKVVSRDKSAIGRELDVWVPSEMVAVELGSWFWHKRRLESDIDKARLCEAAGIDLVTVYDCCPDKIQEELPEGALTYPYSLAEEDGHGTLKEIVSGIADRIGTTDLGAIDWDDVAGEASRRNVARSTSEFIDQVSLINPDVEVLGRYVTSRHKTLCRCRVCGHEWETTPAQLLRGQGCPKCRKRESAAKATEKVRVSPETYARVFAERNPSLTLMSPYKGSTARVDVRCYVCGHEWSPRASSVIDGNGCPICADNRRRKTQGQFVEELKAVNPSIEVLGTYSSYHSPIECRCHRCGYTWSPRPSKLLAGRGCPRCSGHLKSAVRCIETGVVYESYNAAARAVGLSEGTPISKACRGLQPTAAGYSWELVE